MAMETASETRIRHLTTLLRDRQREFGNLAWRILLVRGARPQQQDIEDALADAYLAAATRLRNEPELAADHLEPWFRKVLFFTCLKQGDAKRKLGLSQTIEELEYEDEVLQSAPLWDKQIDIAQRLDSLEPEEREIVRLAGEGYTSAEIASRVGKSAQNVRKIKSRAIGKLQREVGEKAL
jgi:RNA polymerase sigma factor (sigma-70 family)